MGGRPIFSRHTGETSLPNGERYKEIAAHYERCFARHGDNHLGVDWPNAGDAQTRYRVMLELIRPEAPDGSSLLDFGCGASHLYEYILQHGLERRVVYSGLDLSPVFVEASRKKFPAVTYYCADVLSGDGGIPQFDYVVMNGVFTEKGPLSQQEMLDYFRRLVACVFAKTRVGMAFNVMSKQVDWERDDLFHLPFDTLADFLTKDVSRHFILRHDYRLYEYTAYVFR
jgi:cyclopropane fatty-acyl-phospholipid synthase-like methyltransferase